METNTKSPNVEFGDIYQRLTQRFMPDSAPKQIDPKALAIGHAVLAFQQLQDTLQRLVALFDGQAAGSGSGSISAKRTRGSLEHLLDRLRLLATMPKTLWQHDLHSLIARADTLVEVLDFILLSRAVSRKSLSLLNLPEANLSAQEVDQFADEVTRLDSAFFALGAQHVLDCHEKGIGLDGRPREKLINVQPRLRGKRSAQN